MPNSVSKMTNFDTLTLCISLNSSKCVFIFARTLSQGIVYSLPGKKFYSSPSSVFKSVFFPFEFVFYGLFHVACFQTCYMHESLLLHL